MFTIILILTNIILILIVYILFKYTSKLKKKLKQKEFDYKSTVVKHGKNWENFVPFMQDFKQIANKDNFVFLGNPIDGIAFDEDYIKFIEIKTGSSQLNKKQKQIKDQIQNKKIKWFELRT